MSEPAALSDRLTRQLAFIRELDRLKRVLRRTSLIDRSRLENSAEHSWHLTTMVLALGEYAEPATDLARVIELLVVHDVVEIDAGDTFAFDAVGNASKAERETAAAARIFGLLPDDAGSRLRALWEEFEANDSREARFANALDRMQALVLNDAGGDGGSWRAHGVSREAVLGRMEPIRIGAPRLWCVVLDAVERATMAGHIA